MAIAFPLCTWQCNLNCSCLRIWLHFTRRCPLRTQPNQFTRTKCAQQQQKEVVEGVQRGGEGEEVQGGEGSWAAFPSATIFCVPRRAFFSANQMNQNRSKLQLKSRSLPRRRRRRWRHCINIRLWAAFLFVSLLHRPQALGRDVARERAMHILR